MSSSRRLPGASIMPTLTGSRQPWRRCFLEPGAGVPALLLDFSGVDYISSVGLRVLMMAAKQLRGQQRKLGVAAAKPLVGEIFEISRFNLILDLSPTVRAGLERMSPAAVAAYDASASAPAAGAA